MSPSQAANKRDVPNSMGKNPTVTWELNVAEQIRHRQTNDLVGGATGSRRPLMVALVGIPGSGKTTSAQILANLCGASTLCMPFDGYHYPLSHLQAMSNANDLVYRRGAPDTFDAALLLRDLRRIRHGNEDTVALPGFDHAKGDPQVDQHIFHREQHDIVITEGLYLLHDADGWSDVKDCFDVTIYMDADLDVCMDRLKIRNQCIPGYTVDEIIARVDAVDRVNAMTVVQSKHRAQIVVSSVASSSC